MPSYQKIFDRSLLRIKPLKERINKLDISSILKLESDCPEINSRESNKIEQLVEAITNAKKNNAPVILIYGAHMFRNGLSPFIIKLMELGYLQHLVTNGAGSIHDWELSFQGETTEDVCRYLKEGQFGIWEETGFWLNLAVIAGVADGLGYGESIGKMMAEDGILIPEISILKNEISESLNKPNSPANLAAKIAYFQAIENFNIKPGKLKIAHPFKKHSLVYHATRLKIPFSICPGIGYDIIYTHPINNGYSIGQGGLHDFLSFSQTVSKLENGVILSIGSAVMAPQVTEKALSMAKNLASQTDAILDNFTTFVVDIQPGDWDWSEGEPPKDHPAYYLRFGKSFSRLGGDYQYLCMDNRTFIQHLYHLLVEQQ